MEESQQRWCEGSGKGIGAGPGSGKSLVNSRSWKKLERLKRREQGEERGELGLERPTGQQRPQKEIRFSSYEKWKAPDG